MLSTLLELLFPSSCLACGNTPLASGDVMLCPDCLVLVESVTSPLCSCCGRQFQNAAGNDHLCELCLTDSYHFDLARALLRYQPPITTIISDFKYHGRTTALKSFRAIFATHPSRKDLGRPELIIPVPLHVTRLRQRGFNQALLLARAFYPEDRQLINFTTLQRKRHTSPQTGMNGKERRRNLKNAFQVVDENIVKNRKVLLIDDVFTTGTTVSECAKVLKKAGAKQVQVLTVARVD
jgi:ComF family protein